MLIKINGPTFGFGSPPAIGTAVERNGQIFRCVGLSPHEGRNGPTTILHWESDCADCGAPFEVTTGLTGIKPMNTRCPEHIKPGKPSSESAKKAMRKWRVKFGKKQ